MYALLQSLVWRFNISVLCSGRCYVMSVSVELTEGMYVVLKHTYMHIVHVCTPHAPSIPFFSTSSTTTTPPGHPMHTHTPPPLPLYIHTSFSPPLLIITYTAGTLHFISSILSLQGWQAGHKLSWRWGWKLEEIVMKISSVCRSGRSCSCHQPCAGGITPGQHLCVCVWVCSSLCAYA